MNGKGDKLRQGANLNAYWNNYDNIFRKRKKINDEDIKDEEPLELPDCSHSEYEKRIQSAIDLGHSIGLKPGRYDFTGEQVKYSPAMVQAIVEHGETSRKTLEKEFTPAQIEILERRTTRTNGKCCGGGCCTPEFPYDVKATVCDGAGAQG